MPKYTLEVLWCSHLQILYYVWGFFSIMHERNLSTMHPAKISFKLLKDTMINLMPEPEAL